MEITIKDLRLPDQSRAPRQFALISRTTTLVVQPHQVDGRQGSRLEDYLRKGTLLKQIMSNKARRYRAINAAQNIATVAVSSLLLFIGFSGLDKITRYLSWVHTVSHEAAELAFNLLVFAFFVVGVLHLVFRFSDKQSSAEKGIAALATLANEIEDTVSSKGNLGISEGLARLDLVRTRYEAIAEGYGSPTATDDVDVIHYNPTETEKRHDEAIQVRLASLVANANWSVKNQARMHEVNGEEPYTSLEDAISLWPETATAFVARLDDEGHIEFVAPYGFDDLLRLLITNTPVFAGRIDVIRSRAEKKQWQRLWPRLRLALPTA